MQSTTGTDNNIVNYTTTGDKYSTVFSNNSITAQPIREDIECTIIVEHSINCYTTTGDIDRTRICSIVRYAAGRDIEYAVIRVVLRNAPGRNIKITERFDCGTVCYTAARNIDIPSRIYLNVVCHTTRRDKDTTTNIDYCIIDRSS